jgi:molecular chaperone GrpE
MAKQVPDQDHPTHDIPNDEQSTIDMSAADSSPDDQLAAEKDRVLRLQAELQNVRMRHARELRDQMQYAALPLMRDILPVLDNVERAIGAAGNSDDATGLLEGVKLVRQQLLTALAGHQCHPIDAEGAIFNPDEHQAILQQPSADVPAGRVMMVTQAGYKLHDRVVRPSQVIVSAGPADAGHIADADNKSGTQQA